MSRSTPPKCFSCFLEKHKFPHIRFHDLRHTIATLLVRNNVDIKTISSTTMDYYVYSLESANKASTKLLENILIKDISI